MSFIALDGGTVVPAASVGRIVAKDRAKRAEVLDADGRHLGWLDPADARALAGTIVPAEPGWQLVRVFAGVGDEPPALAFVPVIAWRAFGVAVHPVTPSWQDNIEAEERAAPYLLLPPGRRSDALDRDGQPACEPDDEAMLGFLLRSAVLLKGKAA